MADIADTEEKKVTRRRVVMTTRRRSAPAPEDQLSSPVGDADAAQEANESGWLETPSKERLDADGQPAGSEQSAGDGQSAESGHAADGAEEYGRERICDQTRRETVAIPHPRGRYARMAEPFQDESAFSRQRPRRRISSPYLPTGVKRGRPGIRNSRDTIGSEPLAQPDFNADSEIEEVSPDKIVFVNDCIRMQIPELRQVAIELGLDADRVFELKKQELVTEILKCRSYDGCSIRSVGTLEILPEGGFGFLRSEVNSYLPGPEDVFVSPQIIKSYALRTGDVVSCVLRNPQASERFFAVQRILSVNDCDPAMARGRVPFDSLTPLYPDSMINLEGTKNDISMRVVDLFAPIGKGQRALITAPPRTGKTVLLQKIANAITDNYPEMKLLVLLVDERPEEVTDMRRNVKGEVIASTFDEQAQRHVSVAEMVIEKAKRQVEYGKDVVILLDSITRLARAYNQTAPASGKILSGGVDSNALHKPKRFFGAARNIEGGGSLTIIASALIETGSRMDEVIFEEFKGTGNCEIVLDRRISDKRIYPAINLKKSGTRKEELLIGQDDLAKIWLLRNVMNPMDDVDMTEFVIEKMRKYVSNQILLGSMMNSK